MKRGNIYLGIVFSVATIWYISTRVEWTILIGQILRFDAWFFLLLLFISPFITCIRTWRWKIIIAPRFTVSFKTLLLTNFIGFYLNYIFPARMGELARAELIKQREGINRGFMVGTIFAERMLDSGILLCFLFISAFFSPTIQNIIFANSKRIILFIILTSIFLFIIVNKTIIRYFFSFLPRFGARFKKIHENFLLAMESFGNPIQLVIIIFLTLAIWLVSAVGYFIFSAGLNIFLPFYAYSFLIAIAAFGMIIPSAPGNIGVYHGIMMAALLLFIPGEKERALSFAIISHGWGFIMSMLSGLISCYIFKFNFLRLSS